MAVLQGRALKNPVEPLLTNAINEAETQKAAFESAASSVGALGGSYSALNDPANTFPLTESQLSNMATRLGTYKTALQKYKTHSDVLSGVTINYAGFPPNFQGRMGMALAYNQLKESMRKTEDGPCGVEENKSEIFTDVFHSILGYAENEIEPVYNQYLNLKARIAALPDPNTTTQTREQLYNGAYTSLATSITNVNGFKTTDNQGFYKAYNFVTSFSTGLGIVNLRGADDFADRLLGEVNGTDLFNSSTSALAPLKLQCETFTVSNIQPEDGFSERFDDEVALTNSTELSDMPTGVTAGDFLLHSGNGFVATNHTTQFQTEFQGSTLAELGDVDVSGGITTATMLVYDETQDAWISNAMSASIPEGGNDILIGTDYDGRLMYRRTIEVAPGGFPTATFATFSTGLGTGKIVHRIQGTAYSNASLGSRTVYPLPLIFGGGTYTIYGTETGSVYVQSSSANLDTLFDSATITVDWSNP